MGGEVQGVSGHPEVARSRGYPTVELGRWLCEERQRRGLSRSFIAARTRIAPERIEAIERGRVALADDVLGRGTARLLALAIGVDPAAALAHLGASAGVRPARSARPRSRALLWLLSGGLAGLVAMGALLYRGALWFERAAESEPAVVYRPDHVGDLLEGQPVARGS